MQLSSNFSLEELCVTDTGASNIPSPDETAKLLYLATYILQPIRDKWGKIRVNSGFRSEWVNDKIGGAKNSQHKKGEAADISPEDADIDTVFEWCRTNLKFGQLIIENKGGARWIHVSLPRLDRANMQVLAFNNGIYTNA